MLRNHWHIRLAGLFLILSLLTQATVAAAQSLTPQQLAAVLLLINGLPEEEEEPGGIDPPAFYRTNIAGPVVAARCQTCHVAGGFAGATPLIFQPGNDAANFAAISAYVQAEQGRGERLLRKVRGLDGHGGGTVFTTLSTEYQDLQALVDALSGNDSSGDGVAGAGFFSGVTLAGADRTLRRAALMLAGRLPTEAEVSQARSGESGLRAAVLGLMAGEGFHQFLLRGANDRLHTDGFINGLRFQMARLDAEGGYQYPEGANAFLLPTGYTGAQLEARETFEDRYSIGLARAPLELIAYVVENDLPYTEILTADYTMVNRNVAQVYRSNVSFGSGEDHRVFKRGQNRGLVLRDANYRGQARGGRGWEITSHGPFQTYPHAGILSEPAWLNRYPSTETNRNRARARWTYYHFLGVDIEKSAPRSTDPVALADTNNPTLLNSACTVCHDRLDPVAGAYQNYGDEGLYRDFAGFRCDRDGANCEVFGGTDSLPNNYKFFRTDTDFDEPGYQTGDLWYRGMRPPGLGAATLPGARADDGLAWLGQQIVNDPRFATAAVTFWWPALMGKPVLEPPLFSAGSDFAQRVNAFDAQQNSIQALADSFRSGGYNLKNLLADLVMSPWFRAQSVDPQVLAQRGAELRALGVDRLLTPEELEAKTEAVLGYAWAKREGDPDRFLDGFNSALDDRFKLYYGGIDSEDVLDRVTTITALMSNVAERQALEMSCGVVALEFITPPEQRRLFPEIEKTLSPLDENDITVDVLAQSFTDRRNYDVPVDTGGGVRAIRIEFNNDAFDATTQQDRNLHIDAIDILRDGVVISRIEGEAFQSAPGFQQTSSRVGRADGDNWRMGGSGFVEVQTNLPAAGQYTVRVRAWGTRAFGVGPEMSVSVAALTPDQNTAASRVLRAQVRELYELMLGDNLLVSDPEVEAVYSLLIDTWQARQSHAESEQAWSSSEENCVFPREVSGVDYDNGLRQDRSQMVFAWTSVVYYFLTHFDFLHE